MHKKTLVLGKDEFLAPHMIRQLLNRTNRFGSCAFLDNQQYSSLLHAYEFLLGTGQNGSFTVRSLNDLNALDSWLRGRSGSWVFGHISYDLKALLHALPVQKPDPVGFPLLTLFEPTICVVSGPDAVSIISQDPETDPEAWWQSIKEHVVKPESTQSTVPDLRPRMDRRAYTSAIEKLRTHILRGDCYEINFCQEFYAEGILINPLELYLRLVAASPNPFSCYYCQGDAHLMCASPERFLTRRGNRIFSQPIKGTALRNLTDPSADVAARQGLRMSPKEQSENVMVVDLVRNDLSRICEPGSVRVDELFGIYSYPQVHQMISTISGDLRAGINFSEILEATFPMGSMTGAPKQRVMELIDQYEPSRRGLFSGAIGYFAPEGDFDFNVVIRSILYNSLTGYIGYQVGSGITWYSEPEKEYEECLWKARAIREVLGNFRFEI